jgi:ABC-2 type transport system permease protein
LIFHKAVAFFRRDYKTQASYRLAFIMQFFGIFFSVAVFFFLSKLFGKAVSSQLASYGGDYFAFVLVGIAFSSFLSTGLGSFSSSISSAQGQGTLEAMLVTPTKLTTIVLCSSLWNFALTAFNVVVYLFFGAAIFGLDLSKVNVPAAFLVLLLTILIFSSMGIISASFIMVFKRGDPINWLFGSFSSLLGGTYFPITVLPAWLQKASYFIPLFYALRSMRYAVLQGYTFQQLTGDIMMLCIFSLLILPVSLLCFKHAVRQAKIEGSLVTY